MTANDIFDLIFSVLGAVISVMKSVSFLGVSIFHWSIGFLIMSAIITYLLNTVNSRSESRFRVVRRRKEKEE